MKVAILILTLIAVTAYAAPVEEDANIQALIEKLLASQQLIDEDASEIESFQKDAEQDNLEEEKMLSYLAEIQADDDEEAIIEEYFAQQEAPAQLQGWWKKTWKNVKKFTKKYGPTILKYGKYLGR